VDVQGLINDHGARQGNSPESAVMWAVRTAAVAGFVSCSIRVQGSGVRVHALRSAVSTVTPSLCRSCVWSEPSVVDAAAYEFAETAKFLDTGETCGTAVDV
jgi:hypothetical protein